MRASEPLRDEHRALLPELGALRIAAESLGSPAAAEQVARARRLLDRHLQPHMAAEDAALYPIIDRLAGTHATLTMRADHDEIRRRITALHDLRVPNQPDAAVDRELLSALYGLDAIIRLHLAKEEELYYPLLDAHLDEDEAREVIAALHQVEHDLYEQATRTTAIDASRDP